MHETEIAIRSKRTKVPNYIHVTSSDNPVKAFRSWWLKHGLATSPPNVFGPASIENLVRLSRRDQVDPWKCHTQHCSKCRSVLQRTNKIQTISWIGAVASAFVVRNRLLAMVCFLIGSIVHLGSRRIVRELGGTSHPSEVGDRSFSHSQN